MADRDDPPPSYDPRSWAAGAEPRPERQAEASFDPLTWAGTMPSAGTTSSENPPAASPSRAGSAILAGAVALILFSLGGAAAYLARQDDRPEIEAPAPEPQPEVLVEPE